MHVICNEHNARQTGARNGYAHLGIPLRKADEELMQNIDVNRPD
jgi:hypothetical protein